MCNAELVVIPSLFLCAFRFANFLKFGTDVKLGDGFFPFKFCNSALRCSSFRAFKKEVAALTHVDSCEFTFGHSVRCTTIFSD